MTLNELSVIGQEQENVFEDALFFQKIPVLISSIYEDIDRVVAGKGEVGGNMSGIKDG